MAQITLTNETVVIDEDEGTFRTWSANPDFSGWCVTIQEFDGFAYIVRIDVDTEYQHQGIGSSIVKALKSRYGIVIAAPDNKGSVAFFKAIGAVEDDTGVLYGQDIWAIDQGHGVYIY